MKDMVVCVLCGAALTFGLIFGCAAVSLSREYLPEGKKHLPGASAIFWFGVGMTFAMLTLALLGVKG